MPYNFRGMPPRQKLLQIRLSDQERKDVKALADARGLSMSSYVRTILKEKIAAEKPHNRPPS